MAAGLPGKAVHHTEAHAAALANGLGGEEWLEHSGQQVGGDALALVTDADDDVAAGGDLVLEAGAGAGEGDGASLEDDRAAVRHGVTAVDDEVHDGAVELRRVDHGAAAVVAEQDLQLEPFAQHAVEEGA